MVSRSGVPALSKGCAHSSGCRRILQGFKVLCSGRDLEGICQKHCKGAFDSTRVSTEILQGVLDWFYEGVLLR